MLKRIKVGAIVFKVKLVKNLHNPDASTPLDGHITYSDCTIRIDESLSKQRQRDILIHELVHAISETAVLNMTEDQVDGFSHILDLVLLENEELRGLYGSESYSKR